MGAGIPGKSRKIANVFLGESSGPRKRLAWFHLLVLEKLEQAVQNSSLSLRLPAQERPKGWTLNREVET